MLDNRNKTVIQEQGGNKENNRVEAYKVIKKKLCWSVDHPRKVTFRILAKQKILSFLAKVIWIYNTIVQYKYTNSHSNETFHNGIR